MNLPDNREKGTTIAHLEFKRTPGIAPRRDDQPDEREIQRADRHITLAYFDQKSTVDYIGVIQGIPVCFDAKESAENTFSLQNIHPHQVAFMREFEQQDGIAFFLIYYKKIEKYYYLPLRHFLPFWERAQNGGRKSFRFDELDATFVLPAKHGVIIPYLEMINKDLSERDDTPEN